MKKISIILIVVGIVFLSFYFIYNLYIEKERNKNVDSYISVTSKIEQEKEVYIEEFNQVEEHSKNEEKVIEYKAILEIPKINLKQGLIESDESFNSINYAVSIDKNSNYPNINGNFILYAHSGNSKISFFKNLYKINIDDSVIAYYQGIKYYYEIIDKYEIEKTGVMEIIKKQDEKLITLITCVSKTNKQLILVGKQVESEIY